MDVVSIITIKLLGTTVSSVYFVVGEIGTENIEVPAPNGPLIGIFVNEY